MSWANSDDAQCADKIEGSLFILLANVSVLLARGGREEGALPDKRRNSFIPKPSCRFSA
jgi:hypothetical protein